MFEISVVCLLALIVLVQVVPSVGWVRVRRKNVVVNLKGGQAFRGVLYRTGTLLVLRNAQLADGSQVDGEVVVERRNVDFLQVL